MQNSESEIILGTNVESSSIIATHYMAKTLSGRRFLVPIKFRSLFSMFLFFGASKLVALLSCFLNLQSNKRFFVDGRVFESLGISSDNSIFYIGTEGPFQKYSVIDIRAFSESACGDFNFITKLACLPRAAELIRIESCRLKKLSELDVLSALIPKFVSEGVSDNGWSWGRQTIYSNQSISNTNIGIDVVSFIKLLHDSTRVNGKKFIDTNCRRVVFDRYVKLKSVIDNSWVSRVEESIRYLDDSSLDQTGYVCAHRDFVKWNVKLFEDNVFVFDWEYSDFEYPELYDLIHYLVFPMVVRIKKPLEAKCLNIEFFIESANKAAKSLSLVGRVDVLWQLLFYLLDLSLFYIDANGGACDDRVVESYAKIIDKILDRD